MIGKMRSDWWMRGGFLFLAVLSVASLTGLPGLAGLPEPAALAETTEPAETTGLAGPVLAPATRLSRIAFGSCADQDDPQPIWSQILGMRPQLFLFIGDNIYGDTSEMEEMRAK